MSHLVSAVGDLDFGLQLALWQIPKALQSHPAGLKVDGLVIQQPEANLAGIFDIPLEPIISRLDAKQGGIE